MWRDKPFALRPVNFFTLAWECPYLPSKELSSLLERYILPSTASLCHEEEFAKVAMGWHEEGIAFYVQVDVSLIRSLFPEMIQGDSVELFIDTRDLKSSGFNTRFCHHFYFLAEAVKGQQWGEITHFRTEDSHPLCDPQLLACQVSKSLSGYGMKIFIPTSCLHGYDPRQFDRIGFTYRINRFGQPPQHWSVASQEYSMDQRSSLWGSIKLIAYDEKNTFI